MPSNAAQEDGAKDAGAALERLYGLADKYEVERDQVDYNLDADPVKCANQMVAMFRSDSPFMGVDTDRVYRLAYQAAGCVCSVPRRSVTCAEVPASPVVEVAQPGSNGAHAHPSPLNGATEVCAGRLTGRTTLGVASESDAPRPGAPALQEGPLEAVWCVGTPEGQLSELADVVYRASPVVIQQIAVGRYVGGARADEGLAFFLSEAAAVEEGKRRLARVPRLVAAEDGSGWAVVVGSSQLAFVASAAGEAAAQAVLASMTKLHA